MENQEALIRIYINKLAEVTHESLVKTALIAELEDKVTELEIEAQKIKEPTESNQ